MQKCGIMEKKRIDKIAGGYELARSGSSSNPGGSLAARGTESPEEQSHDIEVFNRRNQILEDEWGMTTVSTPQEYFDIVFSRGGHNYMQESGEHCWGDRHYNAVVYDLHTRLKKNKDGELVESTWARKFDVTRSLDKCHFFTGNDTEKVISSPILYAGTFRTAKRARTVWGIAIDLDDVSIGNLADIAHWIRHLDRTPMPSMIVSSGGGLHLYYLFPMGISTLKKNVVKALQRLKHNMTEWLWNGLFSSNPNPDLHQGIWQGFRIPGTPTKMEGCKVIGFVPEEIPYYTVRELNYWFQPDMDRYDNHTRPLTEEEIRAVEEDKYLPSAISFLEAQAKWPDWKPGESLGQWVTHRGLYDWWLKVIRKKDKALVSGRRFYWVQSLVIFAKKCRIPFEELKSDAYSLYNQLEALTVKEENHFTYADIDAALKLYYEEGEKSAARYRKAYIGAKTGYQFRHNRRNGRSREDHLVLARTALRIEEKKRGVKWDVKNGRKDAEMRVTMWCLNHPYIFNKQVCANELGLDSHTVAKWWWKDSPTTAAEAVLKWRQKNPTVKNKSQCARECVLDRKTVIKWWNCTAEEAKTSKTNKKDRIQKLGEVEREGVRKKNHACAVADWRQEHPKGSKAECAHALGISRSTVIKWWEYQASVVDGYDIHDKESSELHDIGAGYNRGYLADRKAADLVMQNTDGYDQQSAETIRKTGDDLADLVNLTEVSPDEIMRIMGIPEPMLPMLRAWMREEMKTLKFWELWKAANPTVDTSQWPKEIQERFEKMMKR